MNGRCETCSAEKVCAYPYKPTECANQRKFEMHPDAVDCPNCNGSGYAYPWKCKPCNGTGLVLRHNPIYASHLRPNITTSIKSDA